MIKNLARRMLDVLVQTIPERQVERPAPNVYSWNFKRVKGVKIAVINRNGRLWGQLHGAKCDEHVQHYINSVDFNWVRK